MGRTILRNTLTALLAAAGFLALRRATAALAQGLELEPARALWRAGGALGPELARALAAGLGVALLLALAERARPTRPLAARACAALAALVVLALLVAPPRALELSSQALPAAAVVALLGATALVALASRASRQATRHERRRAWTLLGASTALALAGAGALELAGERAAPRLVRAEVVRMVPLQGGWEVVARHPLFPPEAGVLAPAPRPDVDGQDLPSLVMPPPCELRFQVRPQDAGASLRLAAGIDTGFVPRKHPQIFPPRVRFEVLIDGVSVFDEELDPVYRGSWAARAWRWVGGEDGLVLRAGQEVRLRTSLASHALPAEEVPYIPAGFGRVRFERTLTSALQRPSAERPNLVLVLQDTLRADRLSCYGYERPTSPALDRLAARGLLYENAYAASSWTWPSTASLLTGLWPEVHQVVSDGSCYLATELDTLAEVLARSGYVCGAFVGNPLILPQRNFDQGFHHFDPPPFATFRKTDAMLPEIERFLDRYGDGRFFLYLHLVDVHWPYELVPEALPFVEGEAPAGYPAQGIVDLHHEALAAQQEHARAAGDAPRSQTPAERVAWARTQYVAAVATGDHWLGEFLAALERRGLDDDTVVVFTSDHGEELFDHGLGTHGHALWEELVRVPLVVAGPGVPVGRVATPVSNRHVGPTLAALGGTRLVAVRRPLDLVRPHALEERPVYFSTEQGWWEGEGRVVVRGLRSGPWSILHLDSPLPDGERLVGPDAVRLFDLSRDPAQRADVARGADERVDELLESLREHVEESQERRTTARLGAGASTRQMLEAIGYTGDER